MTGFFLLLRVKYERKEMDGGKKLLSKDDRGLDDWEILSLSRLLKLGDSLPGKRDPEKKPRVWLDNLLLVSQKD